MKAIEEILKYFKSLLDLKFTGSVEIHFNQGVIARVLEHKRVK